MTRFHGDIYLGPTFTVHSITKTGSWRELSPKSLPMKTLINHF